MDMAEYLCLFAYSAVAAVIIATSRNLSTIGLKVKVINMKLFGLILVVISVAYVVLSFVTGDTDFNRTITAVVACMAGGYLLKNAK